jgi:hypothetical protein
MKSRDQENEEFKGSYKGGEPSKSLLTKRFNFTISGGFEVRLPSPLWMKGPRERAQESGGDSQCLEQTRRQ